MRTAFTGLKKGFIAAVALWGMATPLTAFSASVWEVSKNGNTVYLGGTLHILSPQDYPLPAEYDIAYKASGKVIFETDLDALDTPDFTRKTLQLMTYQDGRTIKDDLSEETFSMLSDWLSERGIPVAQVSKMKASFLGISLSMLEMQRAGLTSQGVDKYFFARATEDQKPVGWFETPEQQLMMLAGLSEGDEDAYIRYTLEELETMNDSLEPMKENWLTGDMQALYNDSMESFKTDYPEVYDEMLTNRNKAWLPHIEEYLSTPETEFVLVGTMHMAGAEGVIAMLESEGYSVIKVNK